MKYIMKRIIALISSIAVLNTFILSEVIVSSAGSSVKISRGKITSAVSYKKGQMTLNWKKLKGVSGYRIKLSTYKNFSKGNKFFVAKSRKLNSVVLKKLTPGKTYYVKLRGYKELKYNGKLTRVYGKYSKVKSVKIKSSNTVKYSVKKIRSELNKANSVLKTLSALKNNDGSGYTKYSYLDWSNFSSDLEVYKTKLKKAKYMYKIINTEKFKKAYKSNKKFTYKNIKNKKVTASARKIYSNLYNSIIKAKSNINESFNDLRKRKISDTWKHFHEIKTSLNKFKTKYLSGNLTEYEKVTIIYHYLCNKIYYEKDNPSKYGYDLWKADSVMYRVLSANEGKSVPGVCGTYACAFQMMCQYYEINSQVLCSENHTWNSVEIDGIWYICDLTIGDECGYGSDDISDNTSKYFSKYFYIESEMSTVFKKTHTVQSILPDFYYFFIKPCKNFSLVSGGDKLSLRFVGS